MGDNCREGRGVGVGAGGGGVLLFSLESMADRLTEMQKFEKMTEVTVLFTLS